MSSTLFLAAAEGGLADTARSIGETFGFNWGAFVSNAIAFLVVAAILYFGAIKKIQATLEERRRKIAEGLAAADKMKAELASAQARAQEIVGAAGQQATKIIEEARTAAAQVGEQERQRAIADAQQIVSKAREAGDAELARLKGELRREFGRLVVAASQRATAGVLTSEQQDRLAAEASRQFAA
ncbi:MAG: ATP synthase F0 subunit B [Verrucomicrobiota bacterium]